MSECRAGTGLSAMRCMDVMESKQGAKIHVTIYDETSKNRSIPTKNLYALVST